MTGTESLPYVLLCILPFALLGMWLMNATLFSSLRKLISSKRWQSTTGRIAVSRANGERQLKGGIVYYPFVKYEYRVNGQTYENNKIRLTDAREGIRHEETVQNNVTRDYPVGKEVQVYYNPDNPAESALRKNNPLFVFLFIPMAAAFDIGLIFYFIQLVSSTKELLK